MAGSLWTEVPQCVLKVAENGYAMYAELRPGGLVVERSAKDRGESWRGSWNVDAGSLTIRIGAYTLRVPQGSQVGLETVEGGRGTPARFFVAPVVRAPDEAAALGLRPALVKLVAGTSPYCAELLPGGVREYPLLAGWAADFWAGSWTLPGGRLSVEIGGYQWTGRQQSEAGWYNGLERQPDGQTVELPAVLAAIDPDQTRRALGALDLSDSPLFEHAGYRFYAVPGAPHGYFASLLEARKASVTGETARYAARCIRADAPARNAALREMRISRSFSATDGLIAVFEDFELPDAEELGIFRGRVVQIVELGETDLERHIRDVGKLSAAGNLTVARDLSSALAALHGKYGYVHSDLRPANVIGRRTGPVLSWRLSDFNCTTKHDDNGTAKFIGTSGSCVPPEGAVSFAACGRPSSTIGPGYDIWGLGIVLLQCATGSVWPQGEPVTAAAGIEATSQLDPQLREIVAGCLAPVGHRWTAQQVHRAAVAAAR